MNFYKIYFIDLWNRHLFVSSEEEIELHFIKLIRFIAWSVCPPLTHFSTFVFNSFSVSSNQWFTSQKAQVLARLRKAGEVGRDSNSQHKQFRPTMLTCGTWERDYALSQLQTRDDPVPNWKETQTQTWDDEFAWFESRGLGRDGDG